MILQDLQQLTATGTILDDDAIAALTIADVISPVVESAGSVDFVVTSSVPRALTVRYQVAEVDSGDFLTEAQAGEDTARLTFTQSGGQGTYVDTLTVPIDNDGNGERTGQIMVTLLTETGGTTTYTVPTNGDESATATIWDNDAPELTIVSRGDVSESDGSVVFTLFARVSPNRSFSVNYDVEESTGSGIGDFISSANEGTAASSTGKSATFNFSNGAITAPLSISLESDDVGEGDSVVTVTLTAEDPVNGTFTNYTVAAAPANADSATITDDDGGPTDTIVNIGTIPTIA